LADCTNSARVRIAAAAISIWFTALLASGGCQAQAAKLSLTTTNLPPLTSSPGHAGFVDEVARTAFGRIGIDVEITVLPAERSLINANEGLDDGDIFRIAGLERNYPNLLRVPEKMLDSEFMAYTERADIRIRDWADLKPHVVAYAIGWRIFDLNVRGTKEITKTASIRELFPLLEKGRADVALMERWQGQWIVRQQGYQVHVQEPPLARVEMFMYLNKKHAALVPKVAKALADMKADGSYQKLYDQYLKPLDTR